MSEIRDIVDVQITRGTRTITREGFGTALVLVGLTDGVASKGFRVKTYSNIQAVAEDFATSDFAYKAAVAYFGATPSPKFLKVGIFDDGVAEADTDYSDALLKIASVDNDFYGVVADTRDPLVVAALADTVAALEKIYITSSASVTILDPLDNTDIGTVLKLATQERTAVLYSNDTASAPEAGWFGKMFPTDAGSATWAFKNLVGITADQLSSTQAEAAFAKNVNTYEYIAGQNVTRYGTVATGEYCDIIRGLDWLRARLAEQVYFRLVNTPKIPYTKAGMNIIESDIKVVLDLAVSRGLITPDFSIVMPEISAISEIDRAARYLPDVKFYATLQGAVHTVKINGTVSV